MNNVMLFEPTLWYFHNMRSYLKWELSTILRKKPVENSDLVSSWWYT